MMQPDVNWLGVLEHHAANTPDKPIAVYGADVVTYQQMLEWSAALAGGLQARGVGAGDVVGLLSYNNIEFLATIFAVNYLGAIAMPINWRLAAPELRFILEHSEARVLVCDKELVDLADEAIQGLSGGRELVRVCISTEKVPEWERFADLGAGNAPPTRARVAADDVHRLMYTSGTTGRPKGVMLSHANLAWKNYAHITEFGFTAADIGLACGPLYHVGALDLVTTTMIAVGATTIIHRAFDAARVVGEIEASRVTCVWTAPAMVRAILDVPGVEARDLSSVRLIIAGGEKMPIPYIERLRRTFPSAWFADAYGLTETVSGDTFLDRASTVTKLGSVGRPCQYLELDIWDEHGASVGADERGEVVLRGPKVFKGYWRDPDATNTAFAGGWFHTGDIGVRDDGRLPLHRRPAQGHDRVRRREHRELGDRARAVRARFGGRSRGRRPPRRTVGRSSRRLRRVARGASPDPGRAHRTLPRPTRQVQGPQGRRFHRRPPEKPLRQNPETQPTNRNCRELWAHSAHNSRQFEGWFEWSGAGCLTGSPGWPDAITLRRHPRRHRGDPARRLLHCRRTDGATFHRADQPSGVRSLDQDARRRLSDGRSSSHVAWQPLRRGPGRGYRRGDLSSRWPRRCTTFPADDRDSSNSRVCTGSARCNVGSSSTRAGASTLATYNSSTAFQSRDPNARSSTSRRTTRAPTISRASCKRLAVSGW